MKYTYQPNDGLNPIPETTKLNHTEILTEMARFREAAEHLRGWDNDTHFALSPDETEDFGYPVFADCTVNEAWEFWLLQASRNTFIQKCAMVEQQLFGAYVAIDELSTYCPVETYKNLAKTAALTAEEWIYIKNEIGVDYLDEDIINAIDGIF